MEPSRTVFPMVLLPGAGLSMDGALSFGGWRLALLVTVSTSPPGAIPTCCPCSEIPRSVTARRWWRLGTSWKPGCMRRSLLPMSRAVLDSSAADGPLACLDTGCGGLLPRRLAIAASGGGVWLGLDISKWAIGRGQAGAADGLGGGQQRQPPGAVGHPRPGAVPLRLSGISGVAGCSGRAGLLRWMPAPTTCANCAVIYPMLKPERPLDPPTRASLLPGRTKFDRARGAALIADLLLMARICSAPQPKGRARLHYPERRLQVTVDVASCFRRI